jgi:hypothetical protein
MVLHSPNGTGSLVRDNHLRHGHILPEQIEPTTGRHALHPIEVVAQALMDSKL